MVDALEDSCNQTCITDAVAADLFSDTFGRPISYICFYDVRDLTV